MKTIVIVGPGISLGGIERASANTANGLDSVGYRVIYHAIFPHKEFFTLNGDIPYEKPPETLNSKRLAFFKTILRIRRSVKNHKPDVVIAFSKFYAALTAFALVGIHTRFIISERSSPGYRWGKKIDFLNRLAFYLKAPHATFAQTQVAALTQRAYYGRQTQVEVIPNIVQQVRLYPEVRREKFILAVGRMNDHLKGFDRLIEAMARVKGKWQLHIAGGDESEGRELLLLAHTLGISSKIKLLGKVSDMDKLYARAGIFVIPSRSEGFPNALAEAMAAGVPCIAFDFVAGPKEIITDGKDGLLVPDGDIERLALAIDDLIQHESKRMFLSQNAQNIRDRFSSRNIVSRLAALIENEI